jgi:hypothetical protein
LIDSSLSLTEGWARPGASMKWHYFEKKRSLCGKWIKVNMHFSVSEQDDEDNRNCTACKKILVKRQTKALMKEVKRRGGIKF